MKYGGEEWGWIGMDELQGVGGWNKGRKTKEGEWPIESGCEMTSLEHGFKYENTVPILSVLASVFTF